MKSVNLQRELSWYFSAAIASSDKTYLPYHRIVIDTLKRFGHVPTERIGLDDTITFEEKQNRNVYDHDFQGLSESIALVGDISSATTGGGMEIDYKIRVGDPVLLVYHKDSRPSWYALQWATSCKPPDNLEVQSYSSPAALEQLVAAFAYKVKEKHPQLPGAYIVIEGGEGCGKTTQRELLASYLREHEYNVVETKEPGGTEIAEMIRKILQDPELKKTDPFSRKAELLLFEAARHQVFTQVTKPALTQGAVVVTDRSYYSTIAYQGFGRGMGLHTIDLLNAFATDNIRPDLSVILDIDPKQGLRKITTTEFGKADRFEQEKLEFHKKVRQGYLAIAQRENNVHIIPYVDGGRDTMQEQIRSKVNELLR